MHQLATAHGSPSLVLAQIWRIETQRSYHKRHLASVPYVRVSMGSFARGKAREHPWILLTVVPALAGVIYAGRTLGLKHDGFPESSSGPLDCMWSPLGSIHTQEMWQSLDPVPGITGRKAEALRMDREIIIDRRDKIGVLLDGIEFSVGCSASTTVRRVRGLRRSWTLPRGFCDGW